jgi:hypothetical protein
MIISAMALRHADTAEREEEEHKIAHSHIAHTSFHTLLDKKKDSSRYYSP